MDYLIYDIQEIACLGKCHYTIDLHIHGLHILGFDRPWIENIQGKKSRKFQKAKLEFALCWELFT